MMYNQRETNKSLQRNHEECMTVARKNSPIGRNIEQTPTLQGDNTSNYASCSESTLLLEAFSACCFSIMRPTYCMLLQTLLKKCLSKNKGVSPERQQVHTALQSWRQSKKIRRQQIHQYDKPQSPDIHNTSRQRNVLQPTQMTRHISKFLGNIRNWKTCGWQLFCCHLRFSKITNSAPCQYYWW